MRNVLFLVVVLALVMNLGCSRTKEEAAETSIEIALDGEANVDISDDGMEVTSRTKTAPTHGRRAARRRFRTGSLQMSTSMRALLSR